MNQHESRELATTLFAAFFPEGGWRDDTFELYEGVLGQLQRDVGASVVARLINRCRTFPRIAEIREEVAEQVLELPTPAEAWEQAMGRGERHRLVDELIAHFGGGYTMRTDDNPGALRGQFMRAFEDVRRRELARFDLRDTERAA
jgi:hypothetical protein